MVESGVKVSFSEPVDSATDEAWVVVIIGWEFGGGEDGLLICTQKLQAGGSMRTGRESRTAKDGSSWETRHSSGGKENANTISKLWL